ncbi:hypothetical protein CEH05_11865 [Halobacillus halophilus]|uniref:Uncharacterized protein n=1 Tax=Halobacillus halophilus (strain ATCC 35676 / DSM 2266 / JCM 20832 / KCTC 3685 / LMG 17431 / NBRC 102448 / NCIMB 2269) TaxID=866895 RepID=I0JNM3_HALH3|nr:hypothetical protein CEH05_11865 [Halobacillus halophilus]CCG45743.1 conserved hypothetical protein [Halobacillus halophilus DSM 2266]
MLTNVLLGFILPFSINIIIFLRKPRITILMYTLGVSIAFVANDWGFNIFWKVNPEHDNPSLPAMPFNLGYFPLLTSTFALIKEAQIVNNKVLILLYSLIFTVLEYVALYIGKVEYYNGWIIIYSFFIYLSGFIVCYGYIRLLKRYQIIE